MQRLINHPDEVVDDMLAGFLRVHGDAVQASAANPRVIFKKHLADRPARVGLVSGGGSGHEPAFVGYLGDGLLDAVAVGEVFSSPGPGAFLEAIRGADRGNGVACLFGNYAGDSMNMQMAVTRAAEEGRRVAIVKARDDIASAPKSEAQKRHGIAGGVLMWKTAGAVAKRGGTLDEVIAIAEKTATRTRSVCVGLSPCTIPAVGKPNFTIDPGHYEFGIGHHGEAGQYVASLVDAQSIAQAMVAALLEDFGPQAAGGEFAVMVSGLGATPLMEQYLMAGHIHDALQEAGRAVWRSYVGDYVTSLDMNGLCLTLLQLDDDLKDLLSFPSSALGLASL
ncbi:dihydroxyacetone kinase subunit DhaK [Superficieibacter sp.]|uniref:dihydroxyacetone kinase subunit DhaK n=1 Tax=Superficieibacter sp. TaxID=2303322 RepID=UPI0028B1AFD6|nr:dihydroxyacetone kinase subunit DhaK [Superficieibacter sp.]